jgi:predicted dehydrogenase
MKNLLINNQFMESSNQHGSTHPNQMNQNQQIRLGIVGCGYVTTMSHLPALQLVNNVQIIALADAQLNLARELAAQYNVKFVTDNYHELLDKVDAVIVAVPHHFHTSIALDFIKRGVHVLLEKPMAISVKECEAMIATAYASQRKLAVGHMMRFYDSNRLMKHFIEKRYLGNVLRFEAEGAVLFENFKASPFTVSLPAGGVLLDTGPHILDLLLWWLGDFEKLSYWEDADGGVEANCRLEVTTTNGVSGTVELSRTRRLNNKIRLYCEEGIMEVFLLNPAQVWINSNLFTGPICASRIQDKDLNPLIPYFANQLSDFANAIINDHKLCVPGTEGMRCIQVIEKCKLLKQSLQIMPWMKLNEEIIRRLES